MKKLKLTVAFIFFAFLCKAQTAEPTPQKVVIDRQTDTQDVFTFKGVEISVFKTDNGYTVVFDFDNGNFLSEEMRENGFVAQGLCLVGNNYNKIVIDCEQGSVTLFQNGFKAAQYEN